MDDNEKIYKIVNENEVKFTVAKVIDFSPHNKLKEVVSLRETDWARVHITNRALTFRGVTYNMNTALSTDFKVPDFYRKQALEEGEEEENKDAGDEDYDSEDEGEKSDEESEDKKWYVDSAQNMPLTSSLIASVSKDTSTFCFLYQPSPGSRKLSLIGS